MVRILAPLSLLALAVAVVAADPPLRAVPPDTTGPATKWAEQLGDRDYATRELATKELDALGEAALPALEKVLTTGSPEAVRRAAALTSRIQARLDNARAIAPKTVDLDLADKPLSAAFAEMEKQTGYQIRVNGDQAVLSKKGDFAAKKEPFWAALNRFADQLGLEVESAAGLGGPLSVNRDQLYAQQQMQLEVQRDMLRVEINRAKEARSLVAKQSRAIELKLQTLKDEERKEIGPRLEKELANLKAQSDRVEKDIAASEQKFLSITAAPPPAGTVVLRTLGSVKSAPSAVAGAVRIHAPAFPGQVAQVSANVIPLLLTATPEPSLRWVRTTEAIITKATAPDGRVVTYDPTAASPTTSAMQFEELQMRQLGRRRFKGEYYIEPSRTDVLGGYTPTPMQSLVRLNAPTGAAVTKLATVEGVLRARMWSQSETIAALKGLGADAARVFAPNGVSLEAKLTADPNDKAAFYLDLVLTYDPSEVNPQGSGAANDPLYFEQVPGGGARPIRPKLPRAAVVANPHGLTLTDDDGVVFTMSMQSGETTGIGYDPYTGQNRALRLKQRYIVRAAKADTGAPSRLTFSGVRQREVSLPFKLTDVTVAVGTMDPKLAAEQAQPQPGGYGFDR